MQLARESPHGGSRADDADGLVLQLLGDKDYAITVKVAYHGKRTIKAIRERGIIITMSSNVNDINFPQTRTREEVDVRLRFVTFNKKVSRANAIAAMSRYGLRPASAVETLSLGRKPIEGREECYIIGAGEFWFNGGREQMVYLTGRADDRDAHLHWGDAIPEGFLFAAVDVVPAR